MIEKMVKLSDVCEFIVDCPHTTAPDEGKGYCLIRTPNIGKGIFLLDGVHRVSRNVYEKRIARGKPQKNDLILAREAPAGNVAIIRDNTPMCLGQRTVLIRPDPNKVNPYFLCYFLLAPLQQYNLLGTANGATVAHVNLPTIRNLKISLPSRKIQDQFQVILSAYDELMENHRAQIRLLEEAAERLYREWFVKFHFPGHESVKMVNGLPERWKVGKAKTFFDIHIGKTPPRNNKVCFTKQGKGIPWASIADMKKASVFIGQTAEELTEEAIDTYHVLKEKVGTIFVSFKLTVGEVVIADQEMCTNEAIAHFPIKNSFEREYVYFYLKLFPYDSLGSTSSIAKAVNSQIIKSMFFIMPDQNILKRFSEKEGAIFDQIRLLQRKISLLQEARDRLLSKLMSQEVEV